MKLIAMIKNGVVLNIAEWDGVSVWNPGPEWTLVDVTGLMVGIGYLYDGTKFVAPPPPPELP